MPLCRDESPSSSSLVRVTLMLGIAALTAGWDSPLSSGSKSSWKPETRGFPRPSPSLRKRPKHEIKFKLLLLLNKCRCSFAVINASVLSVACFSLFLKILYFLQVLKTKHSEAEKSWSEQMNNPICNPVYASEHFHWGPLQHYVHQRAGCNCKTVQTYYHTP